MNSDQIVISTGYILFLKLDGFVFILEYYVVLVFHSPFFIITVKTQPVQQMLSVISKHTLHLYHCLSDCPAPLHAGLDYCLKVSWWRQLLFLLILTEQGENVPLCVSSPLLLQSLKDFVWQSVQHFLHGCFSVCAWPSFPASVLLFAILAAPVCLCSLTLTVFTTLSVLCAHYLSYLWAS